MSEIANIVDPEWQRIASQQCELFIIEAVQKQGAFALAQPLHDAAVHEAGHAIMFVAEGIPVRHLHLQEESQFRRRRLYEKTQKRMLKRNYPEFITSLLLPPGILRQPAWCGNCRPEFGRGGCQPSDTDEHACCHVRQMIAGYIAETLVNKPESMPLASSIDERIAAQMLIAGRWRKTAERVWHDLCRETAACLHYNERIAGLVSELSDALEAAPAKGKVQHHLEGEVLQNILARVRPFPEALARIHYMDANDNDDGFFESQRGWMNDVMDHCA